jgi:glycosyltransferase involved in cell wall biosynthesis
MISIVIPSLNEEQYITDSLKSLKEQDYTGDYEVIVVDNESRDGTAEIARGLGARVVCCRERNGIARVRHVGADAARGDIIVQGDADTVYPRQWLSKIARGFESHPEAVALAGRFFYNHPPWWAKVEYAFRLGINQVSVATLGRPLIISGATFAFRRSAFQAVKGYQGLTFSADQYGISSRLNKAGKVLYDKDLFVFTSPRRVAHKSTLVLLIDVFTNLNRWHIYLCKQCLKSVRKSERE